MLDPEKIKFYLSLFKNLDLSDLAKIFNLVNKKTLQPHEIFINQGDTNKKVAYIKKGLVRAYVIKENGDEITTMVRWEDQIVASYDIIIFNKPSRFIYQALEKTELLEVDFDLAQKIANQNPKLDDARRHFLHGMLGESISKVESFILLSPEERYLQFIKDKPNIANRIPDKYIASLLGITPVSLSRIRKRIASTKKR
ncbi:MAG: Crp/Fnr family transcriptional regulator [Cytophagales bacterium]